jgi:hypothetical protein
VSTRAVNPHRAKALAYLREERVRIVWAATPDPESLATNVQAWVLPAPRCLHGASVRVRVRYEGGRWSCDGHPGAHECAHQLAVRMVTGHSRSRPGAGADLLTELAAG